MGDEDEKAEKARKKETKAEATAPTDEEGSAETDPATATPWPVKRVDTADAGGSVSAKKAKKADGADDAGSAPPRMGNLDADGGQKPTSQCATPVTSPEAPAPTDEDWQPPKAAAKSPNVTIQLVVPGSKLGVDRVVTS